MTKYYREVPVTERLPEKDGRYFVIIENKFEDGNLFYKGSFLGENAFGETSAWLEPVDLKELIVSEAEKSWEAAEGYKNSILLSNKHGIPSTAPNKEQYINQLKQSV